MLTSNLTRLAFVALARFWVCKFACVFVVWRLNLKSNLNEASLPRGTYRKNSLNLTAINDDADANLKTRE